MGWGGALVLRVERAIIRVKIRDLEREVFTNRPATMMANILNAMSWKCNTNRSGMKKPGEEK